MPFLIPPPCPTNPTSFKSASVQIERPLPYASFHNRSVFSRNTKSYLCFLA